MPNHIRPPFGADQVQCSPKEKQTRAVGGLLSIDFKASGNVLLWKLQIHHAHIVLQSALTHFWENLLLMGQLKNWKRIRQDKAAHEGSVWQRLVRDCHKTLQQGIANWNCDSLHDIMIPLKREGWECCYWLACSFWHKVFLTDICKSLSASGTASNVWYLIPVDGII